MEIGRQTYSNIISIVRTAQSFAVESVYPNPTSNTLNIVYTSNEDQNSSFEIVNALGMHLSTLTTKTKSGTNTQTLDLSNLAADIYFIIIKNGDNAPVVKQIIKSD